MKKVYNVTHVRNNLLKILDNLEHDIIITKNYMPVAHIEQPRLVRTHKPALILLGAKPCSPWIAKKTMGNIDKSSHLFSRIIFVCSKRTERYSEYLHVDDIRIVACEKIKHPIITPLKSGISGLAPGDEFFIFSFLSDPVTPSRFGTLVKGIEKCKKKNKRILITTRSGKPSHPVALSTTLNEKIIQTRKELGIPYLIRKFKDDILYLESSKG